MPNVPLRGLASTPFQLGWLKTSNPSRAEQEAVRLRDPELLEQDRHSQLLNDRVVEVIADPVLDHCAGRGSGEQSVCRWSPSQSDTAPDRRCRPRELLGIVGILAELRVLPEVLNLVTAARSDSSEIVGGLDLEGLPGLDTGRCP